MSLVLDASLTMSWYLEDESTPQTDAVLDLVCEEGAVVPALWRLEVANGFQSAIRRKRIEAGYRDDALVELTQMAIEVDAETATYAWTTTIRLADRFGLTIYEASYLELARRRGLPLATLDRELRNAAEALGAPLLGM